MSSSEYHYVQSSSKLIDQEEDEDIEEEEEEEVGEQLRGQKFVNNDEAYERDYENNLELHKSRHRALSVSGGPADKRPNKTIIKPHVDFLNPREKTRRTNSYNETNSIELDQVNQKHRGHSNMGLDISDLKASFKRLLKPKIPNHHSISVNSVKSNKRPTKQDHMLIRFNRSQSHNPCADEEEDEEEEDDEDDFDQQENQTHHFDSFLKNKVLKNGSKLNFLSKSFEDKTIHGHMRTTSAVSEETTPFSSSSTSQSSTPSSSISKNHQADHYVAFQSGKEKLKIVVDENNNNTLNNSIRLDELNKLRKNKQHNDSIRMRHNSSKANAELKSPGNANEAGGNLTQAGASNLVLITNSFDSHSSDDNQEGKVWKRAKSSGVNNYFVITLLFVLNLLNYIDRYTLAGVLRETQEYFSISDGESGLLQTVFICSYMLLAPLFGYLGDRYPRKWLIVFGISFWSFMTLIGSFVPRDKFWLFVLIRSLVGIGEASYSCVAPTIIGDLFASETRTRMLALFYLAVPVGSGLGYIVGSNIAKYYNDWRYALRFTPGLGFFCVILLVVFVKEPKRGGAEGSKHEASQSSLLSDIIYLLKNKTFMLITIGFTFASFVLGGLSWWVPTYVEYAIFSKHETPSQIPLKFGLVTCFSGLIGVALSSVLTPKLRFYTKRADPYVCALGSLIAVPTLYILILITRSADQVVFWFITGIAISAMCLSWTIVADVLLYVIYPTKRSIASALNILISHLFGDAFSPYVIGAISDGLRAGKPDTYFNRFMSLQAALYAGPFFALLSFGAYLFAAIYVEEDKKNVEIAVKKSQKKLFRFNERQAERRKNQRGRTR